jgi:aldose sugar dehydrogenase
VQCTSSGSSSVRTERFTGNLVSPWAMAILPDNRVLVTQKGGTMVLVSADGASRTTLTWATPAPAIRDGGQGGLLDVVLDPDFATSPWVYFTYQEPGTNSTSGTAVGRARLQGSSLVDFQRLYQQTPKVGQDGVHFGSRLAFRSDKTLFVSLGDRGQDNPSSPTTNHAQSLGKTLGKVIRINRDGSIPSGNPFQGRAGALPEIWSLGHRNPQGLTVDSATGALWNSEHGPQGGDEINRVQPGANYAWPLRSYGCPYGSPEGAACRVNGGTHLPLNGLTFNEPLTFWAPTSVAPSNMIVYRGAGFPEWSGQLFVGSMAQPRLWRITLDGNGAYASCEGLLGSLNQRIRDVRQGPDGWIWVLTDNGEIRRVVR